VKESTFLKRMAAFSLIAFLFGLNLAAAKEIPLAFSPRKGADIVSMDDVPQWRGHAVLIQDVVDGRRHVQPSQDGDVIGISRQANDEPYVTREDVPFWCTQSIKYVFHKIGIAIVKDNPSIVIKPTLRELYVTEASTYHGTADFEFTIQNAAGEVVWSGEMRDSSNYWGSTLSEEEFLNALGNAVVNVIGVLVLDKQLNESLANQPQPATPAQPLLLTRPTDLGIRGQYCSEPRATSILSAVFLLAGTVVLVSTQASDVDELGLISVPFFVAGGVLGTISLVKWALRSDWYYVKPQLKTGSIRTGCTLTYSF
jgi:hypothetical protein